MKKINIPNPQEMELLVINPQGDISDKINFFWSTLYSIININLSQSLATDILDFQECFAKLKSAEKNKAEYLILTESEYQKLFKWIMENRRWGSNSVAELVPKFINSWKNAEDVPISH